MCYFYAAGFLALAGALFGTALGCGYVFLELAIKGRTWGVAIFAGFALVIGLLALSGTVAFCRLSVRQLTHTPATQELYRGW